MKNNIHLVLMSLIMATSTALLMMQAIEGSILSRRTDSIL